MIVELFCLKNIKQPMTLFFGHDYQSSSVPEHVVPDEVADQDALPFKAMYGLCACNLRMLVTPEATHMLWNDVKNSMRRARLQHTMLLAATLSNVHHGPFQGGRNHATLIEAAESLARSITSQQFEDLQDRMMSDIGVHDESLPGDEFPDTPDDIPRLKCIQNLPVYVTCQS